MSQDKEENHLIEERRKKLAELRKADLAFPNDFKRKDPVSYTHLTLPTNRCV